jgi:hypothetical protein
VRKIDAKGVLALAAILLLSPVAGAYDTNVDLRKQGGPKAWDVGIVLAGQENVGPTYNGYSDCRFGTVTIDNAGANTVIHWENPSGSTGGDGIDNGEVIHVGFSTSDHDATIVDSYWTDENGARIFGSTVVVVGGHIGRDWVRVENTFPVVAHVNEVRVGAFAAAWPLADLNARNPELLDQLQPVGGGFELAPGESVILPFDGGADAAAVVVMIDANAPDSDAAAINFIQDTFIPCP